MGLYSFQVGKKEKHTISVEFKLKTVISIKVDNVIMRKKSILVRYGNVTFNLPIGEKEKHNIMIIMNFRTYWVFRGIPCEVFVDGKPYLTFTV